MLKISNEKKVDNGYCSTPIDREFSEMWVYFSWSCILETNSTGPAGERSNAVFLDIFWIRIWISLDIFWISLGY